jgi:hypothetical protein
MATENLWGDLSELTRVKTPKSILHEQADVLTKETDGLLEGRIDSKGERGSFSHEFDVVAPSFNNYVYSILRVEHDIRLYPLQLIGPDGRIECNDEEEFKENLGKALSSQDVRRVLSSLLSQIEDQ